MKIIANDFCNSTKRNFVSVKDKQCCFFLPMFISLSICFITSGNLVKTYRSCHCAFRMGQVVSRVYLEDLRSWRIVGPLNRSLCHHNRLHQMLLNDRCCLNLRRCFVPAMMPNLDVSSACAYNRSSMEERKRKRKLDTPF